MAAQGPARGSDLVASMRLSSQAKGRSRTGQGCTITYATWWWESITGHSPHQQRPLSSRTVAELFLAGPHITRRNVQQDMVASGHSRGHDQAHQAVPLDPIEELRCRQFDHVAGFSSSERGLQTLWGLIQERRCSTACLVRMLDRPEFRFRKPVSPAGWECGARMTNGLADQLCGCSDGPRSASRRATALQ